MVQQPSTLEKLNDRIDAIERTMQEIYRALVHKGVIEARPVAQPPLNRAALRDELLARGVTRTLAPEELAMAARWQARSEAERQRLVARLKTLRLTPPLSEVIHQLRAE